jgi:hypothetical protein
MLLQCPLTLQQGLYLYLPEGVEDNLPALPARPEQGDGGADQPLSLLPGRDLQLAIYVVSAIPSSAR